MQRNNAARIAAVALAAVLTLSIFQATSGSGLFQQSFAAKSVKLASNGLVQHVNNDAIMTIDTIDIYLKKKTSKTTGELTVEIIQDNQMLASETIEITKKHRSSKVTADFDGLQVTGEFDVKVAFDGKGQINLLKKKVKSNDLLDALAGGKYALKMRINADIADDTSGESSGGNDNNTQPPPPTGKITIFAHRIPSQHWGPTFEGAHAEMYFVLYDTNLQIVGTTGYYANENGFTITDLQEGTTYYVSPTDCNECHGDRHDVVFHHWEDGNTQRQRAMVASESSPPQAHAYFEYIPPEEEQLMP